MARTAIGRTGMLLTIAAGLGGCATTLTGTQQTMVLETAPAGAACRVERQGRVIAEVDRTPATVMISKSRHGVVVRCGKDGYAQAAQPVLAQFANSSFSNALTGIVLGASMDSASGALYHYPERLRLVLKPVVTDSDAAVAAYRARRRAAVEQVGATALKRLEQECGALDATEACAAEAERIRVLQAERLARLAPGQGDAADDVVQAALDLAADAQDAPQDQGTDGL